MSFLDDMPADIAEALADEFRDGVLTLATDTVADGQGGRLVGASTDHTCKALVLEYDAHRRPADVPATDRRVLVLGATIQGGARPVVGARIAAPDPLAGGVLTPFEIIRIGGDPAGAAFDLQVR
jgi:hypothetical protein